MIVQAMRVADEVAANECFFFLYVRFLPVQLRVQLRVSLVTNQRCSPFFVDPSLHERI